MMSLFLERYRASSRRTRTAFWVVMVSAGIGLVLNGISFWTDYDMSPFSALEEACTLVMFVGLGVFIVGQMQDRRGRAK